MPITLHPSHAVHSGEWLRAEFVEPHHLSVTAAAERLGMTRQATSNLLNARAGLSVEMALRFEGVNGNDARLLRYTEPQCLATRTICQRIANISACGAFRYLLTGWRA